jgi:predicted DNA-binding antitoxin AbrB/MazE fold protein
MATTIDAIYEHGVFRPTEPVEMPEGERVQIVVLVTDKVASTPSPASILVEIAALPLETEGDDNVSRDHDRYLYPQSEP